MKNNSFHLDAANNWALDEAAMAAEYALDLFNNEGRDNYHEWLIKERSCVIHNIFDDDEVLIKQYADEFNRLTAPTTNFYF